MKHLSLVLLVLCLASCGDDEGGEPADAHPEASGADASTSQSADAGHASPAIDYMGASNMGECMPNPSDETRYAIVGFWRTDDCSGDPIATNAFPINATAGCYCWPGQSGENSAADFSCDAEAGTISIVQYNSLNCGEGDDTPTAKTFFVDECHQDIPPTIHARVIDPGPCR